MTVTMTSIRLDTDLADEAAKILGVKSRTEAVHVAAAIRGGASLVHGVQMRKIAEKLSM